MILVSQIANAALKADARRKNSKSVVNGFEYSAPVLKLAWMELNRDRKVRSSLIVEQNASSGDLDFRWDNGSMKLYGSKAG